MPKGTHQQGEPEGEPEKLDDSGSLPDVSQMTTAFLAPTQPLAEERRRKIAEHEREVEEGYALMESVSRAVEALSWRIEATTDPQLRAVLQQNREDLRRFRAELDAEGALHDEARKWLRKQE